MTRSTLDGENPRLPLYPLRVLRIDAGRAAVVRLTSASYGGLGTHWKAGRSVYCPGEDCHASVHKDPWYWRGYGSCEVYNQDENRWFPYALELTEHLELDFRGRWKRGQVWEISRAPKVGKKHSPTTGQLLEERDPNTFPPGLDLIPCLLHLYHVRAISLEVKNPLPPRTVVTPSEGAPPLKLAKAAGGEMADPREVKKLMEEMRRRFCG